MLAAPVARLTPTALTPTGRRSRLTERLRAIGRPIGHTQMRPIPSAALLTCAMVCFLRAESDPFAACGLVKQIGCVRLAVASAARRLFPISRPLPLFRLFYRMLNSSLPTTTIRRHSARPTQKRTPVCKLPSANNTSPLARSPARRNGRNDRRWRRMQLSLWRVTVICNFYLPAACGSQN